MHLRLLTRVHAIAVFVVCSLLYFAWIYPSLHVKSRIAKAWTGSSRRLIVFGDSFSDTGLYVVPLAEDLRHIRDAAEGQRWTEVLCEEVWPSYSLVLFPFNVNVILTKCDSMSVILSTILRDHFRTHTVHIVAGLYSITPYTAIPLHETKLHQSCYFRT
jgi:hypothetical protein